MSKAYARALAGLDGRPRRVLALVWRSPWMAVGGDTYADDMLRLAGGYNVAQAVAGHLKRKDAKAQRMYSPAFARTRTSSIAFVDIFWLRNDFFASLRRCVTKSFGAPLR